ncbi:MAG TPA: hypothetical protein VJ717_01000 [Gemmatimonadaceae bacterium]|nr:hypothetical protein [Gemmatimonadaceae bacterium]
MQYMTRVAIACGVTLTSAVVTAQAVPTRQLGKAEAEFADPFTQISGVRELKDGRVVVVDSRDKVVQLVNLKSGAAAKIGREGQGPGEYSLPMTVIALPGDSSGIFDPLNQRYLLIGADGKTGGFLSTRPEGEDRDEQPQRRAGGGPMFGMRGGGMTPPRGTDRTGNIYVMGSPFRMTADGPPTALDSAPVQRFNRVKKTYETVAYIKVPKPQVSGGSNRMEVRIGGANPFAERDDWAVAPDGRVAIVYGRDYRVEWISPNGQRTSGPATPYTKTKVTDAHKKWWQETARRRTTGLMITNANGRMSASTAPPSTLPPEERDDWPEYFPPFLGNALQIAPNGELWVLRASASDDAVPTYDIFDGTGKLTARVQLPKRSRVVGFGNGTVYVVRSDEDDLQYLQRYRLQ